jgi:hypothetical protein
MIISTVAFRAKTTSLRRDSSCWRCRFLPTQEQPRRAKNAPALANAAAKNTGHGVIEQTRCGHVSDIFEARYASRKNSLVDKLYIGSICPCRGLGMFLARLKLVSADASW